MLSSVERTNKMPVDKRIFSPEALREYDIPDEKPSYEFSIPHEYGTEKQSAWDNAIAGRIADAVSTAHFLAKKTGHESNPTLQWAKDDPVKTVGGLIGTDLAVLPLVKKLEGNHPKLAKGLLMGLGGMGAGLAIKNFNANRQRVVKTGNFLNPKLDR